MRSNLRRETCVDFLREVEKLADRVKGITVQIGGDTQGLSKALSGVNKQINSTQRELKDVERLLKLDPTNTDLLRQRQKLLGDAVNETKDKLKGLKEAEKQVQEQVKQGNASEEQYRALQREIVSTEQSLKKLETAASKSNATLARIGATADKISQGAGKVASATAPITAGIAGAATLAVASMDAVDEGLDTIIKKTGATGQAADELKDVYSEVAKTIPADFADIGAAVGEVNTRLGFTGDKLKTASEQFLKFAKINDVDVNTAVQLVSRAMGDAGIAADEYGEVLDALTVAGQQSGISIDTLAANLAKYGAPMRALGIDTKNAIALFAGWEKAGVNTEIAFSGMKKAISNWGSAGKDASVEFGKTLKAIEAAPDIANATSMAMEVFGAKAGADLADAIQGGRFAVDDMLAAIENAGGAVDTTYAGITDEVDDSRLAWQNLQISMHDLGETIAKTLGPNLLELSQKIAGVFEWFGSLDKGTQGIILGAIAVVAAISPIAGIISGIAGAISFLCANPIVLLIAAIVGLGILIATKGDEIQGLLETLDGWLQNVFAADWTNIFGPVLGEALNTLFANIKNIWDSIKKIFDGVIDFIRGVFTGDWERAWSGVQKIFVGIFDSLVAIAKAPLNGIIGLLNMAISSINKLIEGFNGLGFDLPDWLGGGGWHPSIPTIPKIPFLKNGGILSQGSAVVGDAGPELLTMASGKAVVQPLTSNNKTTTYTSPVTIQVFGTPGQNINELADAVADRVQLITERKARVFA